jgi:hypothetical protein
MAEAGRGEEERKDEEREGLFDYVILYPHASSSFDDSNMSDNSDDDYVDSPEELDSNVFHIWDPLQKPVTLQYTTEQLHSGYSFPAPQNI